MKNLMFIVKFAIIVVIIGWIAKAHALQPAKVPDQLIQESAGTVEIHRGYCQTSAEEAQCIVGYQEATDTYWVLLFEEGILYKIMAVKDQKEVTKWLHPLKGV